MNYEHFISTMEISREPLTTFSPIFRSMKPELVAMIDDRIKSGDIALITGRCVRLHWETRHDCNCEYCEHTATDSQVFATVTEAEKRLAKLKEEEYIYDSHIEEDLYFVKAVKQNKIPGSLFEVMA